MTIYDTQFRSIFWWNQNFYAFWHLEFGADSKPLAEDVVSLSYVRLPTRYTAMKGDISVNFNIGDRDLSNLTLSRLVWMSILSCSIEYICSNRMLNIKLYYLLFTEATLKEWFTYGTCQEIRIYFHPYIKDKVEEKHTSIKEIPGSNTNRTWMEFQLQA